MTLRNTILLFVCGFLAIFSCAGDPEYTDLNGNGLMDLYEDPRASLSERAEDIVKRLTLEQKVSLVVGQGFNMPGAGETIEEKVPGAAGSTHAVDSLGIASIVLADGPAGLRIQPVRDSASTRTYYATAFPISSNLASTWDLALVEDIGKATGEEVKEYGVDILLAPGMNIHRNPLAGRNFEYYSEDPFLSGKMSAAMVNGVQSNGVGTSIKHFAANNQETNRMMVDTRVSERVMRELYLRGFEIAVKESQPWTVMSAYNQVNGTYASQNKELLTTVLREDWGFKGLVMTDWFAGDDAVAQMEAGNDLLMPGRPDQSNAIIDAVESGALPESVLDTNVKRVLEVILSSPSQAGYAYSDAPDLQAHAQLVRKAAADGIVLLKNEEALPFSGTDLKVATYGIGSYDFIAGGTGSGDVNEAYTVSLVEGLENAGIDVNEGLKSQYQNYLQTEKAKQPPRRGFAAFMAADPIAEMPLSASTISGHAAASDIALITLGRSSGEFADRKLEGDFYLTEAEKQMIDQVSQIYHSQGKKVVMLLNIGNVIEMASWRDQVDAIVLGWQGGQEAGNALTDVITGKVNPSGKLPTTFPLDYDEIASAKNFPGEELPQTDSEQQPTGFVRGRPSQVTYEEGLYVGYRYFNSFGQSVAYPFGFGLSYTQFEYENLQLSSTEFDGELSVSLSISNRGEVDGREVVQLYVAAPGLSMHKPKMELKGFSKTAVIAPSGAQTVEIKLDARSLTSFDPNRNAWVAEPGEYQVLLGSSSDDIRLTGSFTVPKEIIVERVNEALAPQVNINELKSSN